MTSAIGPDSSVAARLRRSLELLARERPAGWRRVVDRLGERRVSIALERERFVVVGEGGSARVVAEGLESEVEIITDLATILAVLDDELELARAVREDRVQIRGALVDVAAVHDTLVAYVHAGVRCPGFSSFLGHFREFVANHHTRDHGRPRT